jgi:hypothetical protein
MKQPVAQLFHVIVCDLRFKAAAYPNETKVSSFMKLFSWNQFPVCVISQNIYWFQLIVTLNKLLPPAAPFIH